MVLDYAGEGGYAFSSGIDSMETTGYSYADVFVYNSLDPDNALAHIMYFASEENVNEVVASYLSDESGNALVSWQYADGTQPSTTDRPQVSEPAAGEVTYTVKYVDQNGQP